MGHHNYFIIFILVLSATIALPATAIVIPVTSQPDTVVKGDSVTFIGSGVTNGTITLWVVGRDYFTTKSVQPEKNGNFTIVIKPEDTRAYSSGQYAFLFVDQGSDNALEIEPLLWDDGIRVAIRGKSIANIGKKEDLPSFIAQKAGLIVNSSRYPTVDDIITPYFFYVESPTVHFDGMSGSGAQSSLPAVTAGEKIGISGTTNMGIENQLRVEIRNQSSRALVTYANVPVTRDTVQNVWSYTLAAPGLSEGDYVVTVGRPGGPDTETGSALLSVMAQAPPSPRNHNNVPGLADDFSVLLPIFISIGALGVIAVFIIASLKNEDE